MIKEKRNPTFAQRLSEGVGRGLEMGSQLMQQHQQQQSQQDQGMKISELIGMDVTGLDPEMQKVALQLSMQGRNQQLSELLKQSGKQQLFQEKQGYLDRLFGGQNRQQNGFGDQVMSNNRPEMQEMGISSETSPMIQEIMNIPGFDPTQVSDEDIARASVIDPNLARSLMHAKDVGLREKREFEKLKIQQKKLSPEHIREQHLESSQAQADVKYNQQLQEASKQHELKERTLDRLEELNRKGVTGKPWEKIAEKAGFVNITSEGRREFAADVKNLITDIRSILGGQFSNFEFQTILNAYPSADFSKEANSAIIRNLKEFQDIKKKEVEFAEKLKKENNNKVPIDFQAKVNDKVREYAGSKFSKIKENTRQIMNEEYGIPKGFTLMFDPEGNEMSVPENEIVKLLELGATLP